MTVSLEKDVQDQLLNVRRCRRKPGEVPYPFEHSNGMVDFDIWEHMFLVSSWRGLTMHRFNTPPEVVLDLGCGGGHWTLEAAKQWPSSTVVGFDIANIQPNLQDLEHFRHLAPRVKWAHGNLLEGLPFPSSQFDFVRIAYIGLGVPEDEWQFVLEEICRVMKPGGVLELIEEDLIFPCATLPPEPHVSPKLDTLDLSLRIPDASSSASLLADPATIYQDAEKPAASPLRTMYQGFARKSASKLKLGTLTAESSFDSYSSASTRSALPSPQKKHPQDHRRIKAAWDTMLSSRFLSANLLSVLPFYLSTFFSDVKTHPPYRVLLPPNSDHLPPLRSRHSAESFRPSSRGGVDTPFDLNVTSVSRAFKTDGGLSVRSMYGADSFNAAAQRYSSMHLSRSVNTITACKIPIWEEYEKLFHAEYLHRYHDSDLSLRQMFDRDWNSWQNDMKDRMSMRDRISVVLSWPETPGDKSDPRKWRSEFETDCGSSQDRTPPPPMHYDPTDVCRSIRVFVARKAP
ncbi:hypothetical protein DFP72DRAFT_884720 [Ephemerocybe angulata]|uniref:Methyltransferase domain-containing protein n=1 Tax=Ephemerocybe angulata TaxID=980116 RepID=A0A8H6I6R4_9AGAR|nr:hypothetical protein DFP72DRAFT_884720 [Tulosesus angulatus]